MRQIQMLIFMSRTKTYVDGSMECYVYVLATSFYLSCRSWFSKYIFLNPDLDVRLNIWVNYRSKYSKDERKGNINKQQYLCNTDDTHVIYVFVLFLAAIDQ